MVLLSLLPAQAAWCGKYVHSGSNTLMLTITRVAGIPFVSLSPRWPVLTATPNVPQQHPLLGLVQTAGLVHPEQHRRIESVANYVRLDEVHQLAVVHVRVL